MISWPCGFVTSTSYFSHRLSWLKPSHKGSFFRVHLLFLLYQLVLVKFKVASSLNFIHVTTSLITWTKLMFRPVFRIRHFQGKGGYWNHICSKHLQEIPLQTRAGSCGLQSRQREARLRPERGPGLAEPETIVWHAVLQPEIRRFSGQYYCGLYLRLFG